MFRSVRPVIILALFTACGPTMPNYNYASEPDPRRSEFVIGIADELGINVWENPDLSISAKVRPDGTITMPLVGDLSAAGKTPTQLRKSIEEKLVQYVKKEALQVQVAVNKVASYKFTVSGEVIRPGIFDSPSYVTVAEAIALAGGFTRFAKQNEIIISRRDNATGKTKRIPIAYSFIASGERPEMNLVIIAGDSIFIP